MPSANMRTNTSNVTTTVAPIRGPEFNISSKDVEGLVLEIKENLRISANTLKAMPYRRYPKKFLRNSPYSLRCDVRCDGSVCETSSCARKMRQKTAQNDLDEDPYELLQRLLKDGSLVNEAVRRVQIGFTSKQQYYYDSDEESSPVLRLCSQEN